MARTTFQGPVRSLNGFLGTGPELSLPPPDALRAKGKRYFWQATPTATPATNAPNSLVDIRERETKDYMLKRRGGKGRKNANNH